MAKIRKRKLTWKASSSPRVTGYKVYWTAEDRLDYNAPCVNVGNVTSIVVPDDLNGFAPRPQRLKFGVTAVDAEGNESAMATIDVSGLFRAPNEPSEIRIETFSGCGPALGSPASDRTSTRADTRPTSKPNPSRRPVQKAKTSEPDSDHRIEETQDALIKIDKLLSRFFQEE